MRTIATQESALPTVRSDYGRSAMRSRFQVISLTSDPPDGGTVLFPELIRDCYYVILVPLQGEARYCQGASSMAITDDQYLLMRTPLQGKIVSPSATVAAVLIPERDARMRLPCIDDHLYGRFQIDRALGGLLADFVKALLRLYSGQRSPGESALAVETLNLLAIALGAERRDDVLQMRTGRYNLRRRIYDFIERNVCDETLSPDTIAANNGISVSYLYSLMKDDNTTVARFVQERRLQRAYQIIVTDVRRNRTIAEVAYMVGFKNASHFSTSFTRSFGSSPNNVRRGV